MEDIETSERTVDQLCPVLTPKGSSSSVGGLRTTLTLNSGIALSHYFSGTNSPLCPEKWRQEKGFCILKVKVVHKVIQASQNEMSCIGGLNCISEGCISLGFVPCQIFAAESSPVNFSGNILASTYHHHALHTLPYLLDTPVLQR